MYVYICHSMACSANATHERPLFVQVGFRCSKMVCKDDGHLVAV